MKCVVAEYAQTGANENLQFRFVPFPRFCKHANFIHWHTVAKYYPLLLTLNVMKAIQKDLSRRCRRLHC